MRTPGPAKSRTVSSGIWITVIDGSGSEPNISEKATMARPTSLAKSCAFAEAERGAYTATFTPSACLGLYCKLPATKLPFGASRLHSKVYCKRPPDTGVGDGAIPVPATANESGTFRRYVAV